MSDTELEPDVKAYFDNKGEVAPKTESEPAKEPAKAEAKAPDPVDKPAEQPADVTAKGEAEQKQPEADDDDDGSPEAQERKQRKVNWSAYTREKQQRKETEARLARMQQEYDQKMALINERLAMLAMPQQAPQPSPQQQPAPAEIPDPEQDIFGATKFAIEEVKRLKEQRIAEEQQRQEYIRRQRESEVNRQRMAAFEQRVNQEYVSLGQERSKMDPDFDDAYSHAFTTRVRQLEIHMPRENAIQQARREEFEMAARALEARKDPTEIIVQYAQTLGWQPKPKQTAPDPKRLDSIARAQDVHKTMTGAGSPGSGRSAEVNAEALAKMSSSEFEAFLEKAGDKGFRMAMTR